MTTLQQTGMAIMNKDRLIVLSAETDVRSRYTGSETHSPVTEGRRSQIKLNAAAMIEIVRLGRRK
jgi:hypothetical protein